MRRVTASCALCLVCVLAVSQNLDYCMSTEPTRRPPMLINDVPIAFNGGVSPGHSFLVDLCARDGPIVVQYGPKETRNKTEVEFGILVSAPYWNSNNSVVAEVSAADPPLQLTLVVECGSTRPMGAVSVSADLHYTLTAQAPIACVDRVGKNSDVLSQGEIAILAALGVGFVGICYTVGYRYFAEKRRGFDLVRCWRSGRRYLPMAKDEDEADIQATSP